MVAKFVLAFVYVFCMSVFVLKPDGNTISQSIWYALSSGYLKIQINKH